MRNKIGTLCMLLGTALLCGALSLFWYNTDQSASAEQAVQELLPLIQQQIPEQISEGVEETIWIPKEYLEVEDLHMTEVEIDGHAYIGYLTISSLQLELPVMADWDYDKLKIAPCRYTGTLRGENLVIMAHNYARHFGNLSKLAVGDSLTFTDMDGLVTWYQVVGSDILHPTAVEEMTAGTADLTLFTCTYGGQSRVTVYCDRVSAPAE